MADSTPELLPAEPRAAALPPGREAAVKRRVDHGDSAVRAVVFMVLAVTCFPLTSAVIKYLGRDYPIPEVIWARYAGHLAFCLIAFLPTRGFAVFVSRRPVVQTWRSLLLVLASYCLFFALQSLALPTASAIGFVGPIIVTALSVPMLGERVDGKRWLAVVIGFGGALIILRPGGDVAQWGALFMLGNALLYAIYQVLSRKVASHDPAETSITLVGLAGFLVTSAVMAVLPIKLPTNALDIAAFVTVGLFGFLGHYFLTRAYQWGVASAVAPLGYGELIGSTVLGYFVFGDFPDLVTWIGVGIIVASGLYIASGEHQKQRARAARAGG